MMKRYNKIASLILLLCLSFSFFACENEEEIALLKNNCLKRTLGPNVVGENIYFAYAMALPYHTGKIVSAQVEATIKGAEGTYLENNSYHTNAEGVDVPVRVGNPCTNKDNITQVEFCVDTCAATLRYYYKIPEEARGQSVSFTFSAKADNGETVYMAMGPYTIAKMEMKRNLKFDDDDCYISIADMEIYNEAEAAANPDRIDLVYVWQRESTFRHSFAAPAADPQWLPGIILPPGVSKDTKMRKEFGMIDSHLTDEPNNGTYIDDIDFETIDLSNMPNYVINLKDKGGMWVETQDGKYRAFIYLNSLKTIPGGTLSMKRYTVK